MQQPTQGTGPRSQPARAPGSFSPLTSSMSASSSSNAANVAYQPQRPASISRRQPPPPLQLEHSASDDGAAAAVAASSSAASTSATNLSSITVHKSRQRTGSPATPIYTQFTSQPNNSSPSLHNFSRPSAAGSPRVATLGSPSTLVKNESKKYAATQGLFDSTLPSTATSNLAHVAPHPSSNTAAMSASQIAAQAAVMSHQNNQNNNNLNSYASSHIRQRSQTVPLQAEVTDGIRRGSGGKTPLSPPTFNFTESSTSRDSASPQSNSSGLNIDRLGGHSSAAATAANVVFPRSGHSSPRDAGSSPQPPPLLPPPPIPHSVLERPPSKSEKAKSKLFSRPVKMGAAKSEGKDKALPSPSKIGSALSALQRGNFSTSSLVDSSSQSFYSLNNSSSATIRPFEAPLEEKGKEKKHHFLSRQKQKLKDEYHLPLSSASSNSRPTDPNAPSSLYNFHVPSSVGVSTSSFTKAKKDRKHGDRSDSRLDNESTLNLPGDYTSTTAFPSFSQQSTLYDPSDSAKFTMHIPNSLEEAWPYLKTLLLVVFQGEDVRLPVEDINRIVQMHIQYCIHRKSPNSLLDDLRDFLNAGFTTMDRTLRATPEDKFIPTLVELWLFTFTSILPYLQSVFLPLDLEVAGRGALLNIDQAREFWGAVVAEPASSNAPAKLASASPLFDVRRLVLSTFRDVIILPRYDMLKTIFSRLSLEFLPSTFANMALASPPAEAAAMSTSPPEYFPPMVRPGTAMSLDPSVGSYNSTSTTLLGESGGGTGSGSERCTGRSRAVSNVSFGSHGSDGPYRPYTPGSNSAHVVLSSVREQNVEDSKHVTDMVGRMLQCVSVLSGVAGAGGAGSPDDEANSKKMVELCKMLKLNWLGRGRTGRNRRGIVGGRVKRDEMREELRVA